MFDYILAVDQLIFYKLIFGFLGGYSQRYRNNYHRDGYNGEFNGSAWRGYNNRGIFSFSLHWCL